MSKADRYRPGLDPRRSRQRPSRTPNSLSIVFSVPGSALLPLRLFLGATFLYAGLQKLSDPGFFHPGSQTYIGTQIIGFMHGSPIRPILMHAAEHAVLAGALVIAGEIIIGLLVLGGLLTRLAAIGGLAINLVFYLSASWHVYPYFLGSDIVFVMAWLTLILGGAGGYALDSLLPRFMGSLFDLHPAEGRGSERPLRLLLGPGPVEQFQMTTSVEVKPVPAKVGGVSEPNAVVSSAHGLSRREAVIGAAAAALVFIVGVTPKGNSGGTIAIPGGSPGTKKGTRGGHTGGSKGGRGGSGSFTPPSGSQRVGNTSQIRENTAVNTIDPSTGDPALVIHAGNGNFYAYDAICTHAGCEVGYDPGQELIVCPCHGGTYDPTKNAQVVGGPPPFPLTKLALAIDPSSGDIYLV